jgi:hypothetical protein
VLQKNIQDVNKIKNSASVTGGTMLFTFSIIFVIIDIPENIAFTIRG